MCVALDNCGGGLPFVYLQYDLGAATSN